MREIIIEAGVPPEVRREVGTNVSNHDRVARDLMNIETCALEGRLREEGYIGTDDRVLSVFFVADPDVRQDSPNRPVKIFTLVRDVFDHRHKSPEACELNIKIVDCSWN